MSRRSGRPARTAVAGLVLASPAALGWFVTPPPGVAGGSPVAAGRSPPPAATPAADGRVSDALRPADLVVTAGPEPVRVRIDAIGVDAPVGPVGVEDALLDVFDDVERVAWYRHGPVPGEAGSAVLAAHVDHWRDGAGIFFRLEQLRNGDRVAVDFDDGTVRQFVVAGRERYDRDELPASLFSRQGDARLTMITCGGDFDEERRMYEDNVVVLAVPA